MYVSQRLFSCHQHSFLLGTLHFTMFFLFPLSLPLSSFAMEFSCIVFFVVTGTKLRALSLPGRRCAAELYPWLPRTSLHAHVCVWLDGCQAWPCLFPLSTGRSPLCRGAVCKCSATQGCRDLWLFAKPGLAMLSCPPHLWILSVLSH